MTEIIDPKDIIIINEEKTLPIKDEPDNANIFRYEYDGCVHRFLVEDDSLDFDILCLYGEKNGKKYKKIIKRNGVITEKDLIALEHFEKTSESKVYKTHRVKIVSAPDVCEIDITNAKRVVQRLNNIIQYNCDDLRLIFNYQHMINKEIDQFTPFNHASINYEYHFGMLLCLLHEDMCVSTIELIKDDEDLYINSKTMEGFESKHYNKFLISVAIIIAPSLGCIRVKAVADNPRSAWILYKYYKADILNADLSLEGTNKAVQKKLNEYIDGESGDNLIHLKVELTVENIVNAERMFLKFLKIIKCVRHVKSHTRKSIFQKILRKI